MFTQAEIKAPSTSIDVHNCRSLTCIACNRTSSVVFVKADVPESIVPCKSLSSTERSQASTEPSSLSLNSSQEILTPPPSIVRKRIIFENISSVGVIRAISSNPNDERDAELFRPHELNPEPNTNTNAKEINDMQLNVPYKLTRSRSIDTLDRFVASIETAFAHEDEEDVDDVIFGNPWKRKYEG